MRARVCVYACACVCVCVRVCVCMREWVYVCLGLVKVVINAQVKLSCGMRLDKVNYGMQCVLLLKNGSIKVVINHL